MINAAIKNRRFKDLNPVVCGYEECGKGKSYGPAVRDIYLMHFLIDGKGLFVRDKKDYTVQKGQIFLIRPFEVTYYQADLEDPWVYEWIGFSGNMAQELFTEAGLDETCVFDAHDCAPIFDEMLSASNEPNYELYLLGKLYELFFALTKKVNIKKTVSREYVKHAIDILAANYMNDISISNIAHSLHIDRRYLCRIFTQEKGVSPQQYLVHLRMKKAAALFSDMNITVADAARSVGYSDQFNFSKMFKKIMGVTPSQYKK